MDAISKKKKLQFEIKMSLGETFWQISCPPVMGASLVNYLVSKSWYQPKTTVFEASFRLKFNFDILLYLKKTISKEICEK